MKYKHRRLLEHLNTIPHWSVLDAGGGTGLIIDNLLFRPLKVNVDIDRDALRQSQCDKVLASVTHLPFQGQTFECCIFSEVLEHLHAPGLAVMEVCRVAREVHITTPNNSRLRRFLWWLRGKPPLSASGHIREYCLQDLRRMLKGTGHRIWKVKGIGFIIGRTKWLNWLENRWLSSKLWVVTQRK